jgi:hypothetical protein
MKWAATAVRNLLRTLWPDVPSVCAMNYIATDGFFFSGLICTKISVPFFENYVFFHDVEDVTF